MRRRYASSRSFGSVSTRAVDAALIALDSPFVVADLETTGLDCRNHEILEIGAVRSTADGTVTAEFEMLVRGPKVSGFISRLTGISQAMCDDEGHELADVLGAFTAFSGELPLFFHNSPFDMSFLRRAASKTGVELGNAVHDTLPVARKAWPGRRSYRLAALSRFQGLPAQEHRALADARAALRVVVAARNVLDPTRETVEPGAGDALDVSGPIGVADAPREPG